MTNKSSWTFRFKRSHAKEFGNLGRVQAFQASSPLKGPDRWMLGLLGVERSNRVEKPDNIQRVARTLSILVISRGSLAIWKMYSNASRLVLKNKRCHKMPWSDLHLQFLLPKKEPSWVWSRHAWFCGAVLSSQFAAEFHTRSVRHVPSAHTYAHTHTHQRDTHLRDLTQIDASGLTCPFSKRWCELTWTSHERSKCFIFFLIRFDRLSTDSCFCALTTSVCVIFILCARWASVDAPQMIALYGTRLSALGEGHSFVHLSTLSSLNWLYRQLCHFTWFPPFLSDNCCCCLLQIQQETHIWVIISWVNLNDHFFQAALSTFHKAQSELWPQMCWHIASGKRRKMEE